MSHQGNIELLFDGEGKLLLTTGRWSGRGTPKAVQMALTQIIYDREESEVSAGFFEELMSHSLALRPVGMWVGYY